MLSDPMDAVDGRVVIGLRLPQDSMQAEAELFDELRIVLRLFVELQEDLNEYLSCYGSILLDNRHQWSKEVSIVDLNVGQFSNPVLSDQSDVVLLLLCKPLNILFALECPNLLPTSQG